MSTSPAFEWQGESRGSSHGEYGSEQPDLIEIADQDLLAELDPAMGGERVDAYTEDQRCGQSPAAARPGRGDAAHEAPVRGA
jgi:hypothetical protein